MASKITVRDNSKEVVSLFKKAVHNGLTAVGMTAEKHAKKAITEQKAVDTGLLRNSVTYAIAGYQTHVESYSNNKGTKTGSYSGTMDGKKDSAVYIGTNVEYAPYVENGTSKMAARPFLKPAATEHSDEYKRLFEAALKNG